MTTLFWDKDNKPIEDTIEWAKKFEDDDYRIIAVDVDDPDPDKMHKMVSTIWNGLDRSLMLHVTDDTAMIFETAYLLDGEILDCYMAHSLEGAKQMHEMLCFEMLGREADPESGVREKIVENGRLKHGR